jgi:hypothetical protein
MRVTESLVEECRKNIILFFFSSGNYHNEGWKKKKKKYTTLIVWERLSSGAWLGDVRGGAAVFVLFRGLFKKNLKKKE